MRARPTDRGTDTWRDAALVTGAFVALLWVLEIVDSATGHPLDAYGVQPRSEEGLVGVLVAPMLHFGFDHLVSNTVPVAVLGFLALVTGIARGLVATAIIWVVGGLGVWLFAGSRHHPRRRLGAGLRLDRLPGRPRLPHRPHHRDPHRRRGLPPLQRRPARRAARPARRLVAGPPLRRPRRCPRRARLNGAPATPAETQVSPAQQESRPPGSVLPRAPHDPHGRRHQCAASATTPSEHPRRSSPSGRWRRPSPVPDRCWCARCCRRSTTTTS